MMDVIYENFISVIGIIILFSLTNSVKEYFVEYLIQDELYATEIKDFHTRYFNQKYKKLLINGFFICIFISFMFSYALGRSSCNEVDYTTQVCESYDEDSYFTPTVIQRIGVFTKVFSYTFIIVLITASEGKKRHYQNIYKCSQNNNFNDKQG